MNAPTSSPFYESEQMLNDYLLFHYGSLEEVLPWESGPKEALHFMPRVVESCLHKARLEGLSSTRALDLGCAVGRASFELARYCDEVIGIDYSMNFIEAARQLAEKTEISYFIKRTGHIYQQGIARIPEDLVSYRSRVRFEHGDAQNLDADLGCFDVVLAANLLCRLPEPRRFLNRVPALLKPGGQLIITTPNTWLEQFTAREFWLGATPETGEPLEAIQHELAVSFDRQALLDIPFLIREHERKFQWSVAQASVWRRKEN